MKKLFFSALLCPTLFLASCGGSKDAGCTYDDKTIAAHVVSIIPSADGESAEIYFTVRTSSGGIDTITFSQQFGAPAYPEDLNELDVHAGDSLKCTHRVKTSGNCDPELFVLTREKY
ncbi:MAG TPA: hypothetical protein VL651_13805 [Bacteroidia bacterium]|nr:hypothetical protein [Bacteroidia bacterium]